MLRLSHAPLILASVFALTLSIPSVTLSPRVFISPLPFRFTSALTFSLALATSLILYIPFASTLTLDLMEDLTTFVIYFALASAFGIARALLGLATSIVTSSSY